VALLLPWLLVELIAAAAAAAGGGADCCCCWLILFCCQNPLSACRKTTPNTTAACPCVNSNISKHCPANWSRYEAPANLRHP
jgi:hypothetical protein